METIIGLKKRAEALRAKYKVDSITPEEVGSLLADMLDYMNEVELNLGTMGIRRTYADYATMAADPTPIGDDGKPIRFGQLVAIPSESHLYAFVEPGKWTMVLDYHLLPVVTNSTSGLMAPTMLQELQDATSEIDTLQEEVESIKNNSGGSGDIEVITTVSNAVLPITNIINLPITITQGSAYKPSGVYYVSSAGRFAAKVGTSYYDNWLGFTDEKGIKYPSAEEYKTGDYTGKLYLMSDKTYAFVAGNLVLVGDGNDGQTNDGAGDGSTPECSCNIGENTVIGSNVALGDNVTIEEGFNSTEVVTNADLASKVEEEVTNQLQNKVYVENDTLVFVF